MQKHLKTMSKNILQGMLDLALPPQCIHCKTAIDRHHALCADCWSTLHFIGPSICSQCSIPLPSGFLQEVRCGACLSQSPAFDKTIAVLVYDDHSKKMISQFKYSDNTYAKRTYSEWITKKLRNEINGAEIVIPVPLHRSRLLSRRYNQAALLAREISEMLNLSYLPEGLIRSQRTLPQAGLNRRERRENIKSAFVANDRYMPRLVDKDVILIDDVMTTGATLDMCSQVLKKAQVRHITAAVIARTPVD